MKRDERNLPLSTDSEDAVRLFDRAVEHYLKYHVDTMSLVGSALAADADFVMAHCLKGYLLLSAANPAHQPQIAATLAAAHANATTATDARSSMWPPLPHGPAANSTGPSRSGDKILDVTPTDLLALRICDTTWFRHGQTRRSASRPTASRHAGQPTCLATTCAMRLGVRTRRPAITRGPSARWMPRWNATAPTTSRIT